MFIAKIIFIDSSEQCINRRKSPGLMSFTFFEQGEWHGTCMPLCWVNDGTLMAILCNFEAR